MSFIDRLMGRVPNATASNSNSNSHLSPESVAAQTSKDQTRGWSRELTKQTRNLERDRLNIAREQQKLTQQLKLEAKKGHNTAVRTMAKSIVQSQRAQQKLQEAQTRISSVIYQLKSQQATANVMGVISKSVEIQKQMSQLLSLPAVAAVARAMSVEMAKANFIEELTSEAISDAMDSEETETEAEAEVERVMFELTEGQFGQMPAMKQRSKAQQQQQMDAAAAATEAAKTAAPHMAAAVAQA